jgi:molybdopterin-containing oxidoreductase family iron-sulfur binding subunit
VAYAEGRAELNQDEYQTACTQACPAGAINFGDLNNPEHTVYKLKKDPNAFRLLEKLGTNPKVYYVSSRDWVRKAADVFTGEEDQGITHA